MKTILSNERGGSAHKAPMVFEPVTQWWQQPLLADVLRENARLRSWLLAAVVVGVTGWTVAVCLLTRV